MALKIKRWCKSHDEMKITPYYEDLIYDVNFGDKKIKKLKKLNCCIQMLPLNI